MKNNSKQMRISKVQYEILGELSKELNVSRIEVLSNMVLLAKFLVDNNATTVKIVCGDVEKEITLSMLLGVGSDES